MTPLPDGPIHGDWNIFAHSTFQSALTGFLAAKRRDDPRAWSLGGWAKRLKIGSSATLTNVLKGRRVPSPELTAKLADSLRLGGEARDYFYLMIEKERIPASSTELRRGVAKRMREVRAAASARVLNQAAFRAVSEPRHLILKECLNLRDFREDPEWIGARMDPPLAADEVRRSIGVLLRVGLLRRSPQGRLRVAAPLSDTSHDVPSEAHRKYHRECLDLAKTALERTSVARRDFTNLILSVDAGRLPEMKERLKEFGDEFLGTFDATDGGADDVYHLGLQLYPVTKSGKERNGHA